MNKATSILVLAIFISSCSSQPRMPIEANMHCGVDSESLHGFGLVSFSIDGEKLSKSEIKVSPYEVTSEGCALIPPDASEHIKVKSKEYSAVKSVADLKGRLTKNLELIKVDENSEYSYLYCGEIDEQGSATLKFVQPDDLGENPYFIDTDKNVTQIELSSLNCAKIPKKPGKVVLAKGAEVYLKDPENFNLIEKYQEKIVGFDAVCHKLGKKDKIVKILSDYFKTEDCTEIKEKSASLAKDDRELFYKKGITDLGALAGLPFETLDLCENDFVDLSPLSKVENLKYLQIVGAEIISLEGLPDSLKTLVLGYTPYLQDLNFGPKNITALEIYGPNAIKSYEGISDLHDLTNLTIYNVSKADRKNDLTKLNKISTLKFVESFGYQDTLNSWHMDSLVHLEIITSDLSSSKFLGNFKNLRLAWIQKSNISKWEVVNDLKHLYSVSMLKSPTYDLSYLKSDSIESLYLSGTKISDLSFISHTPKVNDLSLSSTLVTDLTPLTKVNLNDFIYNKPSVKITKCPTENVSEAVKAFCIKYKQLDRNT